MPEQVGDASEAREAQDQVVPQPLVTPRQALADGSHRRPRDDCLPGAVFQVSGQAIDAHPATGDKLIRLDKIVTTSNGDDLLTFSLM